MDVVPFFISSLGCSGGRGCHTPGGGGWSRARLMVCTSLGCRDPDAHTGCQRVKGRPERVGQQDPGLAVSVGEEVSFEDSSVMVLQCYSFLENTSLSQ